MTISKDNPYLENMLKVIVTWVKENNISANACYKRFGTAFSRSDFSDYFVNCTKSPTVSTVKKILIGLGYEIQFHNLNNKIEYNGSLRSFVQELLSPYRPQYLYNKNLLSRSTYSYIMRKKNDTNELYISLEDFTYMLYILNIQLILKKV